MEKNKALILGIIALGVTTAFLGGYVIATASANRTAAQAQVPMVTSQPQTAAQSQPTAVPNGAASSGVQGKENAAVSGTAASGASAQNAATAQQGNYIGEEKAKEIALAHAKLAEKDVTVVKTKLDHENGTAVYEVEFYKGTTEYDYTIGATDGVILGYDFDADGYTMENQNATQANVIGETAAQTAALKHAGFSENQVQMKRTHLDHDDGIMIYKVKFWSGATEYDYEIDATSGAIVSYEVGD